MEISGVKTQKPDLLKTASRISCIHERISGKRIPMFLTKIGSILLTSPGDNDRIFLKYDVAMIQVSHNTDYVMIKKK